MHHRFVRWLLWRDDWIVDGTALVAAIAIGYQLVCRIDCVGNWLIALLIGVATGLVAGNSVASGIYWLEQRYEHMLP
ncbi:MAG: hypothetical protein WAW62_01085 [Candidatus Saccharimonas aalborgensis]